MLPSEISVATWGVNRTSSVNGLARTQMPSAIAIE